VFSGIPVAARPGGRAVASVLALLVILGVVAIAVAWERASDTVLVSDQVDWAAVGLAGTTAVAFGLVASVLVARQAIALRLGRLAPFLSGPHAAERPAAGPVEPGTAPPTAVAARPTAVAARPTAVAATAGNGAASQDGALVAGARMARYHTGRCPLTAGKPVAAASRADHERAGRRPCGVCSP
jgi:hypothetical protein